MVYLDPYAATDIATEVVSSLEDAGYSPSEAIPGLVQAIIEFADGDEELLDAAANFLADGGYGGTGD